MSKEAMYMANSPILPWVRCVEKLGVVQTSFSALVGKEGHLDSNNMNLLEVNKKSKIARKVWLFAHRMTR
jgi:hypothetical protein